MEDGGPEDGMNGFRGGMCQVSGVRCQVSGRCRAQGWRRGRLNSELDEGKLSCLVLRRGTATPLDYPTAKFPSPTAVYVNIKNRPLYVNIKAFVCYKLFVVHEQFTAEWLFNHDYRCD